MTLNLPTPDPQRDQWGATLNAALTGMDERLEGAEGTLVDAARVTSNDTDNGVLTIEYGAVDEEIPVEVQAVSAKGAPGGYPPLDEAGLVPRERLYASATDTGAAPLVHQHTLEDVPEAKRRLDKTPVFLEFDPATNQWPLRSTVAASNTQPVIWFGDATLPEAGPVAGVDFYLGPAFSTPTYTADPTDEPDPEAPVRDSNGVLLYGPTFTVNGPDVVLSANLNTDASKTFTYLQVAVRGPGGQEKDTGYAPGITVNGDHTLTGSFRADQTGTWQVWIAYNLTGSGTGWVDGGKVDVTVTTLTSGSGTSNGSGLPLIGRSGHNWNSGVFYNAGSLSSAQSFETWRGRPLDAILYFTGRATWDDLLWMRDDLTGWPGYRIICLPFRPMEGLTAAQASTYWSRIDAEVASGHLEQWWAGWGASARNKGWNDGRTIVRLSWECNGDWYPWAYRYAGATKFVNTYRAIAEAITSQAPTLRFNLNVNRGNTASGINFLNDIATPLVDDGTVSIIGLDWYNHAPGQQDLAEWNFALNQTNSGVDLVNFARTKGIGLSLDEWGVSHGTSSYEGGGDDAGWMQRMWDFQNDIDDCLAYEICYNDRGAPSELRHSLTDGTNPNAAAFYRASAHWGGI